MITSPEYCTGRELWALGMPSTLSPADPAWEPGQIGVISHTGPGTGAVAIFSGGPTDAFSVRLEVLGSGGLGVGTFRWRPQDAEAWSLATTFPADADSLGYSVFHLQETGITLRLSGTFTAGDVYAFSTTESPQQARFRKALSGEMARKLRVRGHLPLTEWGEDIKLIAARLVAYELLALKGFDPNNQHDKLVLGRAEWARHKIDAIAQELEQSDLAGQSTILGVAASSQPPQGAELW